MLINNIFLSAIYLNNFVFKVEFNIQLLQIPRLEISAAYPRTTYHLHIREEAPGYKMDLSLSRKLVFRHSDLVTDTCIINL